MKNIDKIFFSICFAGLCYCYASTSSLSSVKTRLEKEDIDETQLYADEISFDAQSQILKAEGNVFIRQTLKDKNKRWILCDKTTYNKGKGSIQAQGSIVAQDEAETYYIGKDLYLEMDWTNIQAQDSLVLMKDQSRLYATSLSHKKDKQLLKKAFYTPCLMCEGVPFWDLRAEEITHDGTSLDYKHVYLDIKGVPILYLPIFWHTSPQVKRKTGFLAPHLGNSNVLGYFVKAPFYINLEGTRDLTLTPLLSTKQNPLLMMDYRERFHDGFLNFQQSFIWEKKTSECLLPKKGWHSQFILNYHPKEYRFHLQFKRASDTNYLVRYPLSQFEEYTTSPFYEKNLTSRLIVESFKPNSYTSLEGYSFQVSKLYEERNPSIFPLLRHEEKYILSSTRTSHTSFRYGGRVMSFLDRGGHFLKTSLGLLHKQRIDNHLIDTQVNIDTDAHMFQHLKNDLYHPSQSSFKVIPHIRTHWSYPLISKNRRLVMSPSLYLHIKPKVRKDTLTQQRLMDQDESTLGFTGIRYDERFLSEGSTLTPAIEGTYRLSSKRFIKGFLGYSLRSSSLSNKGLCVSSLTFFLNPDLSIRHRNAFSPSTQKVSYTETGIVLNKEINIEAGHTFLNATPNSSRLSQLYWRIESPEIKNIKVRYTQLYQIGRLNPIIVEKNTNEQDIAFKRGNQSLYHSIGITYQNECFCIQAGIYRSSYREAPNLKKNKRSTLKPNTGFFLSLSFKNLGTFDQTTQDSSLNSILTHIGP